MLIWVKLQYILRLNVAAALRYGIVVWLSDKLKMFLHELIFIIDSENLLILIYIVKKNCFPMNSDYISSFYTKFLVPYAY